MAEHMHGGPSRVEMTLAEFSRVVSGSRDRAAKLRARSQVAMEPEVGDAPPAPPAPEESAVSELLLAVEQLQVAEEELRVKNDALMGARDEAEQERRRYQELFDFAPDAYVVTDASGVIREANVAASKLFGIPRGYLVGKPLANFVDTAARHSFRNQLDCLCGAEQVGEWTLDLRLRDAGTLPIAVRVAAVRDRGGRCSALRWSIRDVTERRQLEERLRQLGAQVEEQVRTRTAAFVAALDEERAARRSAEAAACDAARSGAELAARLGTELRMPLQASLGYAELLRSRGRLSQGVSPSGAAGAGAGGEIQRAAVDSIVALHEHMLGMVEQAVASALAAAAACGSGDAASAPLAGSVLPLSRAG